MATIQFTISNIDLEEFSAKRTILKMSLGIVLVFDLVKPETFQNLKMRMPEIAQNAGYIPIILMGTNLDAEQEYGASISSMDIDQFMFKYGINHFIKISVKTGEGIQRSFETLADEIMKETIRKLGPEEIKGKTQFSYAIAMIGDKAIRKDWISEFGVQRFAAPSTLGGVISRKTLDRDIHHLIAEPKMDKGPVVFTSSIPPTPQPTPPTTAPGGGGSGAPSELREAQLAELKKLQELKRGYFDKPTEKETIEYKEEKREEVTLKKPQPLQPMEFKKEVEEGELSPELKSSIEAEVERLREIFQDEAPKKTSEEKGMKSAMPLPPGGPPSAPPAVIPVPKRATPLPPPAPKAEPTPSFSPKDVSLDDLTPMKKEKFKAKSMKARRAKQSSMEMAMDIDTAVDEDTLKSQLMKDGFDSSSDDSQEEAFSVEYESEDIVSPEVSAVKKVKDEFEEEIMDEGEIGYGLTGAAEPSEMEITTEKLLRKTTVFYRERMNPETLNKLAVILSSEKIYETLKIKIDEIARAATDKGLEIDKDVPIVEVVPEFPGCVCVPSVHKLNAEKEYDIATFLITPLQAGDIPDAKVKLYHKGRLIETIPTPTKVVKTTAAKISAGIAVVVPLLSQFPILSDPVSSFLSGLIPFYANLGGLEGIILIFTGIFALLSGLFYLFKRPKDAKPVETFPELDEKLHGKLR